MPIIDKIKDLTSKDHHKQLVFLFDPDGSYKDELKECAENGIQCLEVNKNYFLLKYELENRTSNDVILLYHNRPRPESDQLRAYPLLDLLLANHELRMDEVSDFMHTYQLNETYRPLVKKYIHLLKTKTNQRKLSTILHPGRFNETALIRGLIALVLDFNTVPEMNLCVSKLIMISQREEDLHKVCKQLEEQDLSHHLLAAANQIFETLYTELSKEVVLEWVRKLKYNMLMYLFDKAVPADPYQALKMTKTVALNQLRAFFSDWSNHATLSKQLAAVLSELGDQIKEEKLVEIYGTAPNYGYQTEELITEVLNNLYTELGKAPHIVHDKSSNWLTLLRSDQASFLEFSYIYHCSGFHTVSQAYKDFNYPKPEDFIQEYTEQLYLCDTHYRKAIMYYERLRSGKSDLNVDLMQSFEYLNNSYDKFLLELNLQWQDSLRHIDFAYNKIKVSKQYDFFSEQVAGIDHKLVVIISDALRYEIAKELQAELISDPKNSIQLFPYLASVPSYTNLGMASLLPTDDMTVSHGDKDLIFKIKDIPTVSTNRQSILAKHDPTAATIDFSDVAKMDRNEGRNFFKAHRLVYIYHDWIDAVGDKKRTEHETFAAVDKAKKDISLMIDKLYGWNVYHTIVTADHGFLYNYNEILEPSRELVPESSGFSRDHIRFSVAESFTGKINGYTFPLRNTTKLPTDLQVALPRAINRFRIKGNVGVQFAHGGASIQELLVPVLKFYKQKKETTQQVTFKRIDTMDKISSGSIKIDLLQNEPVSNDLKAFTCNIGLYAENGRLLSDEKTLNFSSTSSNPKDRLQSVILSLNSEGSRAGFCYLRAYEEKDTSRLNPIHVNDLLKINTLMELDEF